MLVHIFEMGSNLNQWDLTLNCDFQLWIEWELVRGSRPRDVVFSLI